MLRPAALTCLLVGSALAGCSEDPAAPNPNDGLSSTADSDGDGVVDACEGTVDTDGNGVPAWQDPGERRPCGGGAGTSTSGGGSATSTGTTTGDAPAGTSASGTSAGAASTTGMVGTISQADGGGTLSPGTGGGTTGGDSGGGRGPITGLRTPKVQCGGMECDGTGIVCCEHWTQTGISDQRCVPEAQCDTTEPPTAIENDLKSLCDGPEDCAAGSPDDPGVCCYFLQSAPHMMVPLIGGIDVGPGYGRECTSLSRCRAGDVDLAAQGQPTGFVSCNTDADCEADSGKSCQPEAAGDATAGGAPPRPHAKICK